MRNKPLKGLMRKPGAPNKPSVSDSVNRGKINSNIKILPNKKVKTKEPKLKKYVVGVDGPEFIGGSAPSPVVPIIKAFKLLRSKYKKLTK